MTRVWPLSRYSNICGANRISFHPESLSAASSTADGPHVALGVGLRGSAAVRFATCLDSSIDSLFQLCIEIRRKDVSARRGPRLRRRVRRRGPQRPPCQHRSFLLHRVVRARAPGAPRASARGAAYRGLRSRRQNVGVCHGRRGRLRHRLGGVRDSGRRLDGTLMVHLCERKDLVGIWSSQRKMHATSTSVISVAPQAQRDQLTACTAATSSDSTTGGAAANDSAACRQRAPRTARRATARVRTTMNVSSQAGCQATWPRKPVPGVSSSLSGGVMPCAVWSDRSLPLLAKYSGGSQFW